jgi:hypothetical protein
MIRAWSQRRQANALKGPQTLAGEPAREACGRTRPHFTLSPWGTFVVEARQFLFDTISANSIPRHCIISLQVRHTQEKKESFIIPSVLWHVNTFPERDQGDVSEERRPILAASPPAQETTPSATSSDRSLMPSPRRLSPGLHCVKCNKEIVGVYTEVAGKK